MDMPVNGPYYASVQRHWVVPAMTFGLRGTPQVRKRARYRCVCPTKTNSIEKRGVFYYGAAASPLSKAQTLSVILNSATHRERGKVVTVRRSPDALGRYAGAPSGANVKTLRN